MKVLVLIEQGSPSRYWGAALPLLREKGIEASFASVRDRGPLSNELEAKGIPVLALNALNSRAYPLALTRLAAIVRKERFDLVHACESIPAAISALSKLITPQGLRLFHRQHNACPQSTRLFHRLANRWSDRMMTCSRATKEYAMVFDHVAEQTIKVAYNGIIPLRRIGGDEVARYRSMLAIPRESIVLSLVARLREGKGHSIALQAAEIVGRNSSRPVHLVFTGAGDHESAIREAVKGFSGITVHMTGHQDDVAPWFGMADINLMPTFAEAFGIAAVEAMSSGRPLIASGVDGLLEVIEDGTSGLLVPPGDPEALAASITRLLEDPALYERIAVGGIQRVADRFTMECMVDGWIDCYNWALSGGN